MQLQSTKQDARGRHLRITKRASAMAKADTPIAVGAMLLFPNPLVALGVELGMARLLAVPVSTARDWRRGRRRIPQWAIEKLAVALEQQEQAIRNARLDLLANEKSRD